MQGSWDLFSHVETCGCRSVCPTRLLLVARGHLPQSFGNCCPELAECLRLSRRSSPLLQCLLQSKASAAAFEAIATCHGSRSHTISCVKLGQKDEAPPGGSLSHESCDMTHGVFVTCCGRMGCIEQPHPAAFAQSHTKLVRDLCIVWRRELPACRGGTLICENVMPGTHLLMPVSCGTHSFC